MITETALTDGLSVVGGMIGGGLFAVVTRWVRRQRQHTAAAVAPDTGDSVTDAQIDEAAAYWAAAHGQPEVTDIVARKLHLAHRLTQRRQLRRWSR